MGVENRWPDWYAVWLAHGTVLAAGGRFEEAARVLETASLLGGADDCVAHALAGGIALGRKDNPGAVDQLRQAERACPELVRAQIAPDAAGSRGRT
jgi:hypothetical protein